MWMLGAVVTHRSILYAGARLSLEWPNQEQSVLFGTGAELRCFLLVSAVGKAHSWRR